MSALRHAMAKCGIISEGKAKAIDHINNRIEILENQIERMYHDNPIKYEFKIRAMESLQNILIGR